MAQLEQLLWAIVLGSWCISWIFFFTGGRRTHKERTFARHNRVFSWLTACVFGAVAMFHVFLQAGGELEAMSPFVRTGVVALGIIVLWLGQWLMVASRRALGALSNTEVLSRISTLRVSIGPYRYVAHPMYAGLVLALLGEALMFANALAFAALFVFVVPLLWLRARIENRA